MLIRLLTVILDKHVERVSRRMVNAFLRPIDAVAFQSILVEFFLKKFLNTSTITLSLREHP